MKIRQRRKQATRAALKQAALDALKRTDHALLQIEDVTRAAGVAKGTFYVHFADREALLDELLADFNAGLAEELAPLAGTLAVDRPIEDSVREIATIVLAYWESRRAFVRAYASRLAGGVGLEELQFGINPPMQAFVTGAIERRYPDADPVRARLTAQAILAVWLRIALQSVFQPGVPRTTAVDLLGRMTGAMAEAALGTGTNRRPKDTKQKEGRS